jgi:hypothetical protein
LRLSAEIFDPDSRQDFLAGHVSHHFVRENGADQGNRRGFECRLFEKSFKRPLLNLAFRERAERRRGERGKIVRLP